MRLPDLGPALCHVEDGEPVPQHARVRSRPDALADLGVQALARCTLHRDVAREGVEQREVLLRRVVPRPDVAPDADVLEEPRRLDLGRVVGDVFRARGRPPVLVALADLVVVGPMAVFVGPKLFTSLDQIKDRVIVRRKKKQANNDNGTPRSRHAR